MPEKPTTLQNVVNILNIVSVLEPPVVQAILSFVQKMQGKTVEEILSETDSNWADIAAAAKKELGIPDPIPQPPPAA